MDMVQTDDQLTPTHRAKDPTAQGELAREQGQSADACPYPPGSEERHEWLEGYKGVSSQGSALMPEAKS